MRELHNRKNFHWPDGRRMAVALTFDFQGAEGVSAAKDGKQDYEAYTQAEYGPQTGIWRILDILDKENVKATFFTCGAIGERYPDAVKAIADAGHEVAGHGYHHEIARNLSTEQETDVMNRASGTLESVTGYAPAGWRSCTQSPNTLKLLIAKGFLYNSNSFSHDLPFIYEHDGKHLVELPRQPFGDGRAYGRSDSGSPSDATAIWTPMFDQFLEESADRAMFCTFQFHPYISGRAGRAGALRSIVRHMKTSGSVWFPTGKDVATWTLESVFGVKHVPELASVS